MLNITSRYGNTVKPTMRYYFLFTRVAEFKKKKDMEKLEPSHTAGGNGTAAWAVPQEVKHRVATSPSNSTPKYISTIIENVYS